jgi:hypothetical protein
MGAKPAASVARHDSRRARYLTMVLFVLLDVVTGTSGCCALSKPSFDINSVFDDNRILFLLVGPTKYVNRDSGDLRICLVCLVMAGRFTSAKSRHFCNDVKRRTRSDWKMHHRR